MSVIENFAALSAQEQRAFAEALLKTINSESIFSSDVKFEIVEIDADDMTGALYVSISHTPLLEVSREATWTCAYEEDAGDTPDDEEFVDSAEADAAAAFKTTSAVIDGYNIKLVVEEVTEEKIIDVEVDHISHEDAGIGHYEYWGYKGYDSQPYIEVQGTLIQTCDCNLYLTVEPVDEIAGNTTEPVDEPTQN